MSLLDVIFRANKIKEENKKLKSEIDDYKKKLEKSQEVINKTNSYWKGKLRNTRQS